MPIYCTAGTYRGYDFKGAPYEEIRPLKPFQIGGMEIMPLPISHDVNDPTGFMVQSEGRKAMLVTDTGKVTFPVEQALREVDLAIFESNYDTDMLINGRYTLAEKRRIASEVGHMSNLDSGMALRRTMTDRQRKVFLAHLSQNNNTPDVARDTVARAMGVPRLKIDCLEFIGDTRTVSF